MTESGFPLSRYDRREYTEAVTRAERFVDDTTLLRMMRVRFPVADTQIGGLTSDTIKAVHLADAQLEQWNTPLTDVVMRFPDGSIAIRLRETKRWEVWRSW